MAMGKIAGIAAKMKQAKMSPRTDPGMTGGGRKSKGNKGRKFLAGVTKALGMMASGYSGDKKAMTGAVELAGRIKAGKKKKSAKERLTVEKEK
jgi:hypothetical protein